MKNFKRLLIIYLFFPLFVLSSRSILASNETGTIFNSVKGNDIYKFSAEISENTIEKNDLLSKLKEIPLGDPRTEEFQKELRLRVFKEYRIYMDSYTISKEELDIAKNEYAKPGISYRKEKEFSEYIIIASWLQARGENIITDLKEESRKQKETDKIIGVTEDIKFPIKKAKYIFNVVSWFFIEFL